MRLWIKNPLAILASGAEGGLIVEGTRIIELVARGKTPRHDQVFDASRHVIIPGLINTHHHFYQTLTRAHPQAINKELFPWLKALYPIWARLKPDAFRLATRLALTELMMSGVTCSSDHHYVFPAGLEDAMDIQADEAKALGMRMTLNRGSMNLSQKDGGLPPDSVVQDHDTILKDCERAIKAHHLTGGSPLENSTGRVENDGHRASERSVHEVREHRSADERHLQTGLTNLHADSRDEALIQVALAPCSPFSVTRELMRDTASLAKQCGCRLHTHLAETHDEDRFCVETFGQRPLDYLEDCGWLHDKTWLAHGIHFDDEEIKRLGKAGVGVSHCPTSNMVLASGHCRTLELEAAGVAVGLGVDGSASNDASNLMEGVRHALMMNRLIYGADKVTHFDAFRWATEGSARCLGRDKLGKIEAGYQADLAMFTLDELRFSGAGDPLAALVLCGAHRADRVMIRGRWTVEDSAPVGIDVAILRHDHGSVAKLFLEAL
jgi:8-oxoguanine deaminase